MGFIVFSVSLWNRLLYVFSQICNFHYPPCSPLLYPPHSQPFLPIFFNHLCFLLRTQVLQTEQVLMLSFSALPVDVAFLSDVFGETLLLSDVWGGSSPSIGYLFTVSCLFCWAAFWLCGSHLSAISPVSCAAFSPRPDLCLLLPGGGNVHL